MRVLGWLCLLSLLVPAALGQQGGDDRRTDPRLHAWLLETPVTLLDWGMLRLDREVRQATMALDLTDGRDGLVKTGTSFRHFDRRVVAYVSLPMPARSRTLAQCQELYGMLRSHLLTGAPTGLSGASWYLQRIFGSDARGTGGDRPEPFGEMLADMVLLEVTLRVPEADAFGNGPSNIACIGRLDQDRAVEVKPWRPPA
ncbi:hypothetical protein [Niveispirillum fermenti]|uniref:hypothetical protein n=1 Tax=Niveispirillum fermenti TaxID=1233113 RepID=UPI003A85C755